MVSSICRLNHANFFLSLLHLTRMFPPSQHHRGTFPFQSTWLLSQSDFSIFLWPNILGFLYQSSCSSSLAKHLKLFSIKLLVHLPWPKIFFFSLPNFCFVHQPPHTQSTDVWKDKEVVTCSGVNSMECQDEFG